MAVTTYNEVNIDLSQAPHDCSAQRLYIRAGPMSMTRDPWPIKGSRTEIFTNKH